MPNDWTIREGEITTRAAVKDAYGGSTYGGIEPSRTTPNIMIYTDPVQGALSGYNYDGWDANDPNVFYYTGEGANGDQELRAGNRAIYEHEDTNRTLRLFEVASSEKRPGGKPQRYVGAFRLDSSHPYRMEPAPGRDGKARKVIVFRLVREGAAPRDVESAPPQPAAQDDRLARDPESESFSATLEELHDAITPEPGAPSVDLVPSEKNTTTEFEHAPRAGGKATREEAKLVASFEAHLRSQGHVIKRARIAIPGVKDTLVTDTYDVTEGRLYEAKSASDRATIRLGVGQLMDYLRFLPEASGAILVQAEPSADLKVFIWSAGFTVAYRKSGSWISE